MDTTPSETIERLEADQSTLPPSMPEVVFAPHSLPDTPLARIHPTPTWVSLNLSHLWAYRELVYFLTWRDVEVRCQQTLLGAGWAVIQPLLTLIIFTFIFGCNVGAPSDGTHYPIFAHAGFLPPDSLYRVSVEESGDK